MSADAKDTLFIFFMGVIPSMFFNQGLACWIVICIAIYLFKSAGWRQAQKDYRQHGGRKEALDKLGKEKGFKVADHLFDENGNLKKDIF